MKVLTQNHELCKSVMWSVNHMEQATEIDQSVWWLDMGLMFRVQFSAEATDFPSHYCIWTDSGVQPSSYTMGTGALSTSGKLVAV